MLQIVWSRVSGEFQRRATQPPIAQPLSFWEFRRPELPPDIPSLPFAVPMMIFSLSASKWIDLNDSETEIMRSMKHLWNSSPGPWSY